MEKQHLTNEQELALQMFQGEIPCVMMFSKSECAQMAEWIVFYEHEEPVEGCSDINPAPVCEEHRRALTAVFSVFWRMWMKTEPIRCERCESTIRVGKVVELP
jgi:hypothetical protein